jgi:hypothetical protein
LERPLNIDSVPSHDTAHSDSKSNFHLIQSVISTLRDKAYLVTGKVCQNLRLYIGVSKKVWYGAYQDDGGRYQSRRLGPADALTVSQAREMAREAAAQAERVKREKPAEQLTLGSYLIAIPL